MNKSNNRLMRFVALFAICCAAASSNAAETVVIGPVEKIANRGNAFTVLGQTFQSASRVRELAVTLWSLVSAPETAGWLLSQYVC